MSKKTLVVYFSGTGGTEYIAKKIGEHIENRGLENKLYSLDLSSTEGSAGLDYNDYEYILLLYPVYSFDAPRLVFEWIEGLNDVGKGRVAVVSVSGGGDVVLIKTVGYRATGQCFRLALRAITLGHRYVEWPSVLVPPRSVA